MGWKVTDGHGWSRLVTGRVFLLKKGTYFWVTGKSRVRSRVRRWFVCANSHYLWSNTCKIFLPSLCQTSPGTDCSQWIVGKQRRIYFPKKLYMVFEFQCDLLLAPGKCFIQTVEQQIKLLLCAAVQNILFHHGRIHIGTAWHQCSSSVPPGMPSH